MGTLKFAFGVTNAQTMKSLADFFVSQLRGVTFVRLFVVRGENVPELFVAFVCAVRGKTAVVANCFALAPFVHFFLFLCWACAPFIFIGDFMLAFVFLVEVRYRKDTHLYFTN